MISLNRWHFQWSGLHLKELKKEVGPSSHKSRSLNSPILQLVTNLNQLTLTIYIGMTEEGNNLPCCLFPLPSFLFVTKSLPSEILNKKIPFVELGVHFHFAFLLCLFYFAFLGDK